MFYYKIYDADFYHKINLVGHKLKKVVVGKAIWFSKLTKFSLFFDQEGFNSRNLCNICNADCFSFAAKRKSRCEITY